MIHKVSRVDTLEPGDYGLVVLTGDKTAAVRFWDENVLGWKYRHAVVYVGGGTLVEARLSGVTHTPVEDYPYPIVWFGIREDGTWPLRIEVAHHASRRLGQSYDWISWMFIPMNQALRSVGLDLSGLLSWNSLSCCSALVAEAYRDAGLDLIHKPALNLVTPDDLDPER